MDSGELDLNNEWSVQAFEAGTAILQDRIAALKELRELEEEESGEASA